MTAKAQQRLLQVVLALAGVSVALMMIIALFGLPKIFSSADNSEAVKRGSDLQACRSTYASRVTEATTAANDLVLRGLAAVGRSDQAELTLLVTDPPGVNGAPIDDARELVQVRTAVYAKAVVLSRRDPDQFLENCRRLDTTSTTTIPDAVPATPIPGVYQSCETAREAGAAPLRADDPGWNPKLDRDSDGVACE